MVRTVRTATMVRESTGAGAGKKAEGIGSDALGEDRSEVCILRAHLGSSLEGGKVGEVTYGTSF